MQKYELMFILPPDLGEEGTQKEQENVKKIIAEGKGEVFNEDQWGVRELAYRIKKQDEGFYTVFNFSMDPTKIAEMEKSLTLNQKILRFLIVKIGENYTLKTYSEYCKEWELEDKKEAEEKKEKSEKKQRGSRVVEKKPTPKPPAKKTSTVKPTEEKNEEKEEKKIEEEKEVKKEAEKSTPEFSKDMDDKLKSIIDDPDISL